MKRFALAALAALCVAAPAHSTVLTTSNSVTVTGSATPGQVVTVPFRFLSNADLVVSVAGITKTLTTDYSVTGAGSNTGGTVTSVAAWTGAVVVTRTMPYTQPTGFRSQGAFSPSTVEQSFDRGEMQLQQVLNGIALGVPPLGGTAVFGSLHYTPGTGPSVPTAGDFWSTLTSYDGSGTSPLSFYNGTSSVYLDYPALMPAVIAQPVTPTAGSHLYGYDRGGSGGMVLPTWTSVGDAPVSLMPSAESNWSVRCLTPAPGITAVTSQFSSVVAGAVAAVPAAGTAVGSMQALDLATGAGAGSSAGVRGDQVLVNRGSVASTGGFLFFSKFATTTAVAQQRVFVGLTNTTTALANQNPSAGINNVYIGYDSAATALSACGNDATGTATCTSLGANFPVNSTAVYDVYIYSRPNDSSVRWAVERLDSSFLASGTISTSADLPANTVMLAPQVWVNNGTTALAASLRLGKVCVSSRF